MTMGDGDGLDPRVARGVTGFALAISLLLLLLLPLLTFVTMRSALEAETRASALLGATAISDLASRNPEMWRYENTRIRGMINLTTLPGTAQHQSVLDMDGYLVAEDGAPVPAPRLRISVPVYESGFRVGELQVDRSLRHVAKVTATMTGLAILLASLAFLGLRLWPMRLLERTIARASHLAAHDALTGLPHRRLLRDRLELGLALGVRDGGGPVAMLCLDLDDFKNLNAALGYDAGDELLRLVAKRLSDCISPVDMLARLNGDRFAVLQTHVPQPRSAQILAERMQAALASSFDLRGRTIAVTASIGIALSGPSHAGPSSHAGTALAGAGAAASGAAPSRSAPPAGGRTVQDHAEMLLLDAETALEHAKREGRSGLRFFDGTADLELRARKALEDDLRGGLLRGEFSLAFQPQVDLESCRILGAEALLRWRHPTRGHVPPDEFIPLAEETGLILPLGEWVMRQACRSALDWPGLRIAVNVSVMQFQLPGFASMVAQVLGETGLEPTRLELEITESLLLADTARSLATLGALRRLGISIAMDDFGTGYSSLGYLRRFRFDKIKIDRGFIRDLGRDPQSEAITRAVVGIGRNLGIRTNAEGVETESQARLLRAEGCLEAQGYLFGRPMPAAEFTLLLQQGLPPERVAAVQAA